MAPGSAPPEPPAGSSPDERLRAEVAHAGLCATCRHVKRVANGRSTFYQCGLAATDERFSRYPRLPVRACPGHAAGADAPRYPSP